MDSVKSFFANPNKENNLGNQQNGVTGRWNNWNRNMQAHSDNGTVNATIRNATTNSDAKRKDSDNYFYIMWRA